MYALVALRHGPDECLVIRTIEYSLRCDASHIMGMHLYIMFYLMTESR